MRADVAVSDEVQVAGGRSGGERLGGEGGSGVGPRLQVGLLGVPGGRGPRACGETIRHARGEPEFQVIAAGRGDAGGCDGWASAAGGV
ncbi:MAG: hypothetical protein ABR585_07660 [Gemmatimonadaceae bacterium]